MSSFFNKFNLLVDKIISIYDEDKLIKKIEFVLNDKNYIVKTLDDSNLNELFEYFNSFTEAEKEYFGFPLFVPRNKSFSEFKQSYNSWINEKNSWNVFMLYKKENLNEIIAMSYIKKMNHVNNEDTEYKSPTWFNSVKAKYRTIKIQNDRNLRLSYLMGLLVLVQAEYMKISKVFARGRSNNKAVKNYLKTLNFKKTGRIWKVKKDNSSFDDIEYEISI